MTMLPELPGMWEQSDLSGGESDNTSDAPYGDTLIELWRQYRVLLLDLHRHGIIRDVICLNAACQATDPISGYRRKVPHLIEYGEVHPVGFLPGG